MVADVCARVLGNFSSCFLHLSSPTPHQPKGETQLFLGLQQALNISSEVWAAALAWGAGGIVVTLCATSWAVLLLVLIELFLPDWSRLRPWRERFHSFPRLSFKAWLALCWASLAAISLLILLYSFDMISYIAPVALAVVWAGLLCIASWAILAFLLLGFLLTATRQP